MSIPYSGNLSRSAGLYSAYTKQLKIVNFKPIKQVVYTFDPFQKNVRSIRDTITFFSSQKILNTNPRCVFKTEIVDNTEPSILLALEDGKKVIFKTENLSCLEILQQFNKIVVPLVPKEEESTGKVAGKIAGGKLSAKGPAQKQGKRKG